MKYTHMYTGPDGQSHFEDLEMPMKSLSTGRVASDSVKAVSISFRESSPGNDRDWHHPSHRQYVITLDGEVDIVSGGHYPPFRPR